jgi:hypothetical protein
VSKIYASTSNVEIAGTCSNLTFEKGSALFVIFERKKNFYCFEIQLEAGKRWTL